MFSIIPHPQISLQFIRQFLDLSFKTSRRHDLIQSSRAISRVKWFKKYNISEMGMEPAPETLYFLNHLTWLMAQEDYIKVLRLLTC